MVISMRKIKNLTKELGLADTLSHRIVLARVRSGLKQWEVAEALGIKPPSVSDWETGKTEPEPENLVAFAKVCGCSLLWLIEGDKNPVADVEQIYLRVPEQDREMALQQAKRVLERWLTDDSGDTNDQGRSQK